MPEHQRIDHKIIENLITEKSHVLDLGCGNGDLLKLLIQKKKVKGTGLEKDLDMVCECLSKGLPVIHANLDKDLEEYQSNSFDVVVLSLTLQALKQPHKVVNEMLRIGKKAIVSFPNFGHIRVRSDLFFRGRMPRSKFLPYEWYDTPNIHFCSIKDFKIFCREEKFIIVKKTYLKKINRRITGFLPNLFASMAIFVLEK